MLFAKKIILGFTIMIIDVVQLNLIRFIVCHLTGSRECLNHTKGVGENQCRLLAVWISIYQVGVNIGYYIYTRYPNVIPEYRCSHVKIEMCKQVSKRCIKRHNTIADTRGYRLKDTSCFQSQHQLLEVQF